MGTIGFIGGGNMAEALIKGISTAGLYNPGDIFVSDIRAERLKVLSEKYNVATTEKNAEAAGKVDILVLSVKPQNMDEALDSIKGAVNEDVLVISIAAGVRVKKVAGKLGDVAIVRVMPNTPALVGEGASALYPNDKAKPELEKVKSIFSAVGRAVVLDREELMDAVTAVSGSGPAYYFFVMEQMTKAAVQLGLPEELAEDLVLQTAKGAALLAVEAGKRGENPAELRRKVTSPGGTTEAAIKVFTEGNLDKIISNAIAKARDRSRELSA